MKVGFQYYYFVKPVIAYDFSKETTSGGYWLNCAFSGRLHKPFCSHFIAVESRTTAFKSDMVTMSQHVVVANTPG